MSLTDALLLDGFRDPLEFWIGNFGPGAPRGSGTQSDPWNAVTMPGDDPSSPYAALSLTSLTRSGTTATATVPGHPFKIDDWVTISGVSTPIVFVAGGYYFQDAEYMGTFKVTGYALNTFTYEMEGVPDSLTAAADQGGIHCWREREMWDAIMRAVPAYSTIHFTGLIDTKGGTRPGRWVAQSGQRLIGSSMATATLRLVGALVRNEHYWAVEAITYVSDFHAESFTIDCNSQGQVNPYVSCGALLLGCG